MEPMSFVKACQDFFSKPPHSKKVEISEFKTLTDKDRAELREMLISEGYTIVTTQESASS